MEIYQTTRAGDRLAKVVELPGGSPVAYSLDIDPTVTHQVLVGVGGSFTESSAQALSELSPATRREVLNQCFGPEGAHYSLTRTHIGSCDFSVTNYSYAPVPGDAELAHFSIEPDRKYLLGLIGDAQSVAGADFRIMASPWTAPPWMKTNGAWNGGSLREEYYQTFADYLVKYLEAYREEGIPIWGLTPTNEPLGNDENWESMHFSAEEMARWIAGYLGPTLEAHAPEVTLWAYDQNRGPHLLEWADVILGDRTAASFVDGMAVHWYESTNSVMSESLDYVSSQFPDKRLIHSEGCIDAMGDDEPIGVWLEDDWYWRPEATDWGYYYAPEDLKSDHPPYRPFYRYARDLIGGLNHNLVGWVDWNLALNTRGGPNHARNFCLAPILIDSGRDQVFYTPLFYAISHVSRFIRPGAVRIGLRGQDENLMATAFRNPDGSIAVVLFNLLERDLRYRLTLVGDERDIHIPGQAMQTIVFRQP